MRIKSIAALGAVLSLAACSTPNLDNSAGRRTVYQDVATTSAAVAGVGMEAQDIVSMTDRMARDILSNPAIAGRATPPRIVIDADNFHNESSSRINKNQITDRLRVELTRAAQGRMLFLGRHYGDMVSKEREAKRSGEYDGGTIRATKAKAGADFRLGGRITSTDAMSKSSGMVNRSHQIVFELVDQEYETIVWSGIYEFRKEAQDDVLYR
jgi:hypothetical protein